MTIEVDLPDGSVAEFPDDTPHDAIKLAIAKRFPPAEKPRSYGSDPGFMQYYEDRARERFGGKKAPDLPPDAGVAAKIAGGIASAEDFLSGLAATGSRGLTFGLSDDAAALGATAGQSAAGGQTEDFGARFQQNDRNANAEIERFKEAHPIVGNAAEIAGAVTSPLGNIGGRWVASGPSMLSRAGRAATVGAGLGGAGGAAYAEGGTNDRAGGALVGAGTGGILGGVLTPAIETVGNVGRSALDILRNNRRAATNPQAQAQNLIAQAMQRDNVTAAQAAQQARHGGEQGLVDVAGPNVVALGRQATVAPGEARAVADDFFNGRAAGSVDRAADALGGLTDRGYYGTLEQLDATRRAAAAPLYDAAYARPGVEQWTPQMAFLMRRPSMRSAYSRAASIAAEEGRNPRELGLVLNEAGEPQFLLGAENGQVPSTQTLDYVKRGLDDVMQSQPRDPATGRIIMNEATRAIDSTRREFVGMLRRGNPEYAQALDAWAGPSRSIDVMDLGRQMWKKAGDPADMIRRFRNLSPADQEYARIGLMREALNKLGNLGDNASVYNALFNNRNKRALFESVFPSREAFNRFADAMRREQNMATTQRTVMGGSPTSRIDADKADAAQQMQDAMSWARLILGGDITGGIRRLVDQGGNNLRGMNEQTAAEVARMLFNPDAQANVGLLRQLTGRQASPGLLRQLSQQQLQRQARQGAAAGFLGRTGGAAGAQLGGLVGANQ